MRNEIIVSRLHSAKRLHKQAWSHRLLAGHVVEVPPLCRSHGYNVGPSRAASFEMCISLHIPWGVSINLDEPAAGRLDLHRLHHRWPRCSARGASRVDPLSQTRLGLLLGGLMSLEMPSYSLFCGG